MIETDQCPKKRYFVDPGQAVHIVGAGNVRDKRELVLSSFKIVPPWLPKAPE
jgi:hypothetical protein